MMINRSVGKASRRLIFGKTAVRDTPLPKFLSPEPRSEGRDFSRKTHRWDNCEKARSAPLAPSAD
jgi:hypothetical protein